MFFNLCYIFLFIGCTRTQTLLVTCGVEEVFVLLSRGHLFQLLDSSLESMLHTIGQIKVSFSHFIKRHGQYTLCVLQSRAVAFDTLERLCPADQSLDVFVIYFQHGRTIRNDAIKIGNLLVTSGAVRIRLEGQFGGCFSRFFECFDALGVMLDSSFKVCILVCFVTLFFVEFDLSQSSFAAFFHLVKLWFDSRHHALNFWITSIQSACKFQGLVGSSNIGVLHLFFCLATKSSNLFVSLQFQNFLLHSLQVGICGLNRETGF
mmetsp:Transcript_21819/g.33304  ORF Transcript_21819/g.33304 Transcript_21819/m.33304 type:complete len:262 (-) Transcript_21819:524-1309(-)